MAVLNYSISESNFELIRDRIGAIVKDELDNQASIQADPRLTAEVYVERFTPVDPSEEAVIVVYVDRGNYSQHTQITQRAKFSYFLDLYTYDKQTDSEKGYTRSAKRMQRLAGLIVNVIQAPEYKTLGFVPGIIYNRSVTDFQADKPTDNQDANFARMGRIILSVEHHNQQPATEPIIASGYDTKVKLDETEKGYKFITDNT